MNLLVDYGLNIGGEYYEGGEIKKIRYIQPYEVPVARFPILEINSSSREEAPEFNPPPLQKKLDVWRSNPSDRLPTARRILVARESEAQRQNMVHAVASGNPKNSYKYKNLAGCSIDVSRVTATPYVPRHAPTRPSSSRPIAVASRKPILNPNHRLAQNVDTSRHNGLAPNSNPRGNLGIVGQTSARTVKTNDETDSGGHSHREDQTIQDTTMLDGGQSNMKSQPEAGRRSLYEIGRCVAMERNDSSTSEDLVNHTYCLLENGESDEMPREESTDHLLSLKSKLQRLCGKEKETNLCEGDILLEATSQGISLELFPDGKFDFSAKCMNSKDQQFMKSQMKKMEANRKCKEEIKRIMKEITVLMEKRRKNEEDENERPAGKKRDMQLLSGPPAKKAKTAPEQMVEEEESGIKNDQNETEGGPYIENDEEEEEGERKVVYSSDEEEEGDENSSNLVCKPKAMTACSASFYHLSLALSVANTRPPIKYKDNGLFEGEIDQSEEEEDGNETVDKGVEMKNGEEGHDQEVDMRGRACPKPWIMKRARWTLIKNKRMALRLKKWALDKLEWNRNKRIEQSVLDLENKKTLLEEKMKKELQRKCENVDMEVNAIFKPGNAMLDEEEEEEKEQNEGGENEADEETDDEEVESEGGFDTDTEDGPDVQFEGAGVREDESLDGADDEVLKETEEQFMLEETRNKENVDPSQFASGSSSFREGFPLSSIHGKRVCEEEQPDKTMEDGKHDHNEIKSEDRPKRQCVVRRKKSYADPKDNECYDKHVLGPLANVTNECCRVMEAALLGQELILVGPSKIAGNGLIAREKIPQCTVTAFYDGIRGSKKYLNKKNPDDSHYMIVGKDGIDGHPTHGERPGKASVANHSKTPNCAMVYIKRQCGREECNSFNFFLVATRDIMEGEELVWTYGEKWENTACKDTCGICPKCLKHIYLR